MAQAKREKGSNIVRNVTFRFTVDMVIDLDNLENGHVGVSKTYSVVEGIVPTHRETLAATLHLCRILGGELTERLALFKPEIRAQMLNSWLSGEFVTDLQSERNVQ
jgi:hypothetical protein